MTEKERLYETLGELLFAIAKADGIIRDEEVSKLDELLKGHPWASEIKWSFDYEVAKNTPVEEVYDKVINFCHAYGPTPEYNEFIKAMQIIAEAPGWVDEKQESLINSFSKDLTDRFRKDIEKLM